jgi:hypothetical protein
MHSDLQAILDEARAQIARGAEPDPAALEARIRAVDSRDRRRALEQLTRLLAVHRARRAVVAERPRPPRPAEYRATPTIAANMAVRARATGETVTLEWDARPGVTHWQARIGERPDARSPYVDRDPVPLEATRVELRLGGRPQRVHLLGRNAAGRLVQRAVISGLTSANWSRRWLQRASAS